MKHFFLKTVLFLFAFTLSNCESKTEDERWNPELPPITQIGANTFGCKINGQVMIPRDSRVSQLGGIPTGVTYGWSTNTASYDWIKAVDRYTNRGGVAFKLPEIQKLGVGEYIVETMVGGYVSTKPNVIYMGASYFGKSPTSGYGSIKGTGKIIITRYDDEVIAGTFYCKLKNNIYPDDIIEITEGRFDFNKNTINSKRFR
ncbi:hypothetical protein JL193_15200 [Polaribacter batillariae]|uniref:Uncharacterized protein n=1 Tax=Polaribacter batillariae TaxID=2808900 RepID=A0ABX7ST52_9FLAO|nr:hypothetical protein [Polaribacter batillariae]QTD37419.1 hypothetical protein JL193_15200 [Polaribacter batillariae]